MTAQPSPEEAQDDPVAQQAGGYAGGPELTLMEHLKELRNRVIIMAVAVVIGIVVCFIFWENIMSWLMAPARSHNPEFTLSAFSPMDRVAAMFRIGFMGGILLASPVIVYQIVAFIVPGLTPSERRMLLPALFGVAFFLLLGMSFAYWILLPVALEFLLNLGSGDIQNVIGIRQYVDFTTRVVFFVGLAFELPMVIALLAKLNMVNWRQLLGFWRYAIVLVFVIGAIATPTPDPLTQAMVAGPLFTLYFVGILFAYLIGPTPPPKLAPPA